jgi:hypothetical protein
MWIMVTKKIPVEEKYTPEPLSMHWAVPWDSDYKEKIAEMIKMDAEVLPQICDYLGIEIPHNLKGIGTFEQSRCSNENYISQVDNIIADNVNEIVNLLSENLYFYDSMWGGKVPNKIKKQRIIVNGEPVGIFPHEFSIVSYENMNIYINEGLHDFVPSEVAHEEIGMLTKLQKLVEEQAQTDGCTLYQARMVAIGRDPMVDFPPPLGWYRAKQEVIDYFF